MQLAQLISELEDAFELAGDVTVSVRHSHQSYNIARDTMAIIRDGNGEITGVSFALMVLPIGVEE